MHTLARSPQAFETCIHSFKTHIQVYNILRKARTILMLTPNKEHLRAFLNQDCMGMQTRGWLHNWARNRCYCHMYNFFLGLNVTLFYTHYSCLGQGTPAALHTSSQMACNTPPLRRHIPFPHLPFIPAIILTFTPKHSEPAHLPTPIFQGNLHTTYQPT